MHVSIGIAAKLIKFVRPRKLPGCNAVQTNIFVGQQ